MTHEETYNDFVLFRSNKLGDNLNDQECCIVYLAHMISLNTKSIDELIRVAKEKK